MIVVDTNRLSLVQVSSQPIGEVVDQAARDYIAKREAQERRLAQSAADPAIKRIHAEMADRYAEVLREENERAPSSEPASDE